MCIHVQVVDVMRKTVAKALTPKEVPQSDDQTKEIQVKTQIEPSINKQKFKSWWKKMAVPEQCKNMKVPPSCRLSYFHNFLLK